MEISVSDWDSKHFGFRVAKCQPETSDTPLDVSVALDFCAKRKVSLLIARATNPSMELIHALESSGFLHMDTLVRYECTLANLTPAAYVAVLNNLGVANIMPLPMDGRTEATALAKEVFSVGALSHFHSDPRLPAERCADMYRKWVWNSFDDNSLADEVCGYLNADGVVVGFGTLKRHGDYGELVLAGAAPQERGKGIYRAMASYSLLWAEQRGATRFTVETQLQNYPVQRVWVSYGLVPVSHRMTFHRWFD